jgi:hypothetical protein
MKTRKAVSEEIRKYTYLTDGKENQAEIEGSENCDSGLRADRKHILDQHFLFLKICSFLAK